MPPAKKKQTKPPKKTPAAKKSGNVFAVVGSDEANVKEAALELSRQLAPADAGDFGSDIIDGIAENADHAGRICADTIQAIQTLPFFGGAKLVWLKNANFASDTVTGRARAATEGLDAIAELLQAGVPDDVRFLFSATDIDKRRSFYLTLKKVADLKVFDRPEAREGWEEALMPMVEQRARERGLRFRHDALEHFVAVAGEDTRLLYNELEKLDLYLGPERREATSDDVKAVVSLGRGGVIFEIGNAIGNANLPAALALVDHFLYRGESAIGILLGAITPKVRSLLYAKHFETNHGLTARASYPSYQSQVARLPESATAFLPRTKKDNKPSVYPVYLAAREAQRFPPEHLHAALAACLEANHRLVQTSLEPKLVLDQLLARILTLRQRAAS